MLTRIRIRNLAVVEDAELEFEGGLNVLTGTTGAGKSLILGAVNLLLGEKASSDQIRRGESVADVEAAFSVDRGGDLADHANGDGVVVLRRELRANGRSQAYVGERAATVREVQAIASLLFEPHGQNEQYRLRDPQAHVEYLDAFAGNGALRADYTRALDAYRTAESDLAQFERRIERIRERSELLEHRVAELERADVSPGEKDELERSLRVMENAEGVAAALRFACEALYDDDASAVSVVARVRRELSRVAGVDETLAGFARDIEGVDIALHEAADAMRRYLDAMDHDPETLRFQQERLDVLIGLERRYGKPLDGILAELESWRGELEGLAFEDERRAALEQALDAAAAEVGTCAGRLCEARRAAAKLLDRKMTSELRDLMMEGATFRTDVRLARDPSGRVSVDGAGVTLYEHGAEDVRLFVRPNPGESEGPVDRIASTGETSRVALALKKLTRAGAPGSVLVFDEIDAGVGADLGDVIAAKLLELSATYQIICITHMPQIAARGARHLVVTKHSGKGRTRVDVRAVDGEERRAEIARMLGGRRGSDNRLALAAEMLRRPSEPGRGSRAR